MIVYTKKKVLNENDNIKWTSARYFCKQKCKKKTFEKLKCKLKNPKNKNCFYSFQVFEPSKISIIEKKLMKHTFGKLRKLKQKNINITYKYWNKNK